MDACVRRYAAATGLSLPDAAACASGAAARLLGLEGKKGALAVGCDADLVVIDGQGQVPVTVISYRSTSSHRHHNHNNCRPPSHHPQRFLSPSSPERLHGLVSAGDDETRAAWGRQAEALGVPLESKQRLGRNSGCGNQRQIPAINAHARTQRELPNSSGDTNKKCFYLGSGSAGGRVIQERRCGAGMQQRRLCCSPWPI